ncbi:MAG: ATP-binding protein [Christiangramia sp.]|uniref:histidine kinase n=1 Tax=Christiangramia flava JLT2011 TaxID=1229726 RepID=A0A1L7IA89_9FLAO|nr:ATP-binding protein [Christiangramia flava]APU70025.1 Sensor protein [Christiangramia flava JLT2011]OSS39510.1 hypothetical protein C723_1412 [Christiangramia flava JLT2011]
MTKDAHISDLEKELQETKKQLAFYKDRCKKSESNERRLFHEVYQYKELIHSSTALITLLLGPDFVIDFANDAIRKVWGKGDQVTGKPLLEVLPELKGKEIEDYLNFVYQTGETFEAFEEPVEHIIDGEKVLYYFDFTYQAQYDLNGELVGIGVFAQDVTERAILNQKIKKNEKEFRELVNLMPHKISVANSLGETIFYNQAWLDYVGKSMNQFLDTNWTEVVHPDHTAEIEHIFSDFLPKGEDFKIELKLKSKTGDYLWHLCQVTAIKDEHGQVNSWISSSTEIQQLKEEEEKQEAFLKLVSHELKTPVTSIKGYIQLIQSMTGKENEQNKTLKPYLKRVEDQVERLIHLISEMLDLSRIEQNELELNKTEFDLNRLVEEAVEDICYTNQEVRINIHHEDEFQVLADRNRIEQVMLNFLTNAIKYSPENKHIDIRIFKRDKNSVGVKIKDHGLGISRKDRQHIFRRFFRVEGKNQDTYSGFGIGLYLSNEIIERHNGKIFVKSKVGEGSEFIFTLPLNQN